jgi:hypothetical protein
MFSECTAPRAGLSPSPELHEVTMKLSTPDGAQQIATPTAAFELGCVAPPSAEPVAAPTSPAPPPAIAPPVTQAPAVQGPTPVQAPRGCATAGSPWGLAVVALLRRRRARG